MKPSIIFAMKTKIAFIFLLAACSICIFCVACKRSATTGENKSVQFELPEVPTMLPSNERGAFVASHYWDKFDFNDTVSLWGEEMQAEQIFADYVAVLWQVGQNEAARSIQKLLTTAETANNVTFTRFIALCEKYFYDPNSPMRNEEFYILALEYIINSPAIPEIDKLRPKNLLELALKNRVGTQAADFTYTLYSGDTGQMYNIKADYTILFFNNPDCNNCKEIRETMSASPLLTEMIDSGQLKILAIYPDQDLTIWQNYRHNIPATWINAYDKDQVLNKTSIYDLKAIPTLYLLSHNKSVLIKDALSPQQIEHYLTNNKQS